MSERLGLPIPYGWFAVAYGDEVDAGGVVPVQAFGRELVLFRTESGTAHVLDAFCPHLGAHLGHGGRVEGEAIKCPFHGWVLDGAGAVVDIPYARTMPRRAREGACIHSYPVLERSRLVWAWYHPRRLAPLFDLDGVPELSDPAWTEPDRYQWEIDTHLQESGENAVDTAHFASVHGTLGMPEAEITLHGHRRDTDFTMVAPAIDDDGNVDFTRTEPMHLVTWNCGPGMSCQTFSRAFRTVMLGAMTPITADRMLLRFAFTRPVDASPQHQVLTAGFVAEVVRQVEQDIPIWEHKAYRQSPILCDGDGPIAKYRRWFGQFYDTAPAIEGAAVPLTVVEAGPSAGPGRP